MSDTDDDIDGILALFQLYEQKMYHITYAILHDSHLAEDAVMDAFVKMLEHNYRIEDPKSDASKRLVIAVTRSAAIDLYRKNKRVSSKILLTEDPLLLQSDKQTEAPSDPEKNAESILQGLPSIYYDVMFERYVNGKSISETASLLGVSEAAVRKRQEWALLAGSEKG